MFPQWLPHMPINRSSSPCGPLHKAAGVSSQQGSCSSSEQVIQEKNVKVTQSCLTLCDLMDYTVYGILQARILEWVVVPFSRGLFQPRDQIHVSCIASRFFTSWATREAQEGAEEKLPGRSWLSFGSQAPSFLQYPNDYINQLYTYTWIQRGGV